MRATRLKSDGTPLDSASPIVLSSEATSSLTISHVRDAAGWLVASSDGTDLFAAHVKSDGTLLEGAPKKVAIDDRPPSTTPVLVAGATHTLAVYQGSSFATEAVRLQSDLTAVDAKAIAIVFRANSESAVQLDFEGTNHLVAWLDDRVSPRSIYAVHVKPDGTPVESSAKKLVTDAAGLSLAYGAGRHLVAWAQQVSPARKIRIARVKTDLSLEDATPIDLATTNSSGDPSVGFDGTNFLVAWNQSGTTNQLQVVRVKPDGTVLDTTPIVLGAASSYEPAAIASGGGRWLVAWGVNRATTGQDVIATRIATDGTVQDAVPIVVAGTADSEDQPAVAYGSGSFLVTFVRQKILEKQSVASVLVADGGTVLDATTTVLCPALYDCRSGTVASDGAGFFATYLDSRSGAAQTYGARISFDGYPATADGFLVAPFGAAAQLSPSAVRKFLVGYNTPSGRAAVRTVTFGGDIGAACGTSSDCDSAHCVDGVCCDGACDKQCEACDVAGSVGRCVAATGKPHGTRAACSGVGVGTTCGEACDGVDRLKCNYPKPTTPCGANECSAGVETHLSTCNGAGLCSDVSKACGAYACAGAVCGANCATKMDCAAGFYCKGTACEPIESLGTSCSTTAECGDGAFCTDGVCCESASCEAGKSCATTGKKGTCAQRDGQSCTSAAECGSGFCVDGVCCESACTSQCAACDVGGQLGKCVAIAGKPHGAREACAVDPDHPCASRFCDASDTTKCAAFTALGTICRAASCADGTGTPASTCDGAGKCEDAPPESCAGFTCKADGSSCLTSCSAATDCVDGYDCIAGKCTPRSTKCSPDDTAVIASDGVTKSCAPLLCRGGKCIETCATSEDCADGNVCDSSGRCIPPATTDSTGCNCATAARSTTAEWLVAASALLGMIGVLRRRNRPTRGAVEEPAAPV